MEKTIATKFDKSALPRWAQNDALVTALCAQSLTFRCDLCAATKQNVKAQLKREAHRYEDRGDGTLELIDASL